ncbi:MAG: hypothetical protein HYW95_02365 [Candidatus Wildermuthbacteria bacterium]|nr:hypothetical protein [Candidatus Wildermuthbacteria bacterium]
MIKEIVTHGSPAHLDELMAYLMLADHGGEEKLPGVSKANFRCLTKDDNLKMLAHDEHVVLLGIGAEFQNSTNAHRIFDEHVFNGDKSKKDECAATLVAKFLGLDQQFTWRQILKYVLHTDKNPPSLTLDLAPTVIRFQRQGWSLSAVVRYADDAIHAKLEESQCFANVAMEKIHEEELDLGCGGRQWLAVIETDDVETSRFARFMGAALAIVKNPTGHIQILSAKHLRLDLRDILRILRLREQWIENKYKVTDWRILEQEGTVAGIPQWFFHEEANDILNGGQARPDVPATKIPISMIVESVKLGLETHCFEPSRETRCKQGVCTSTAINPCPLYRLGLLRCRQIRAKMYLSK